MRIFWGFCDEWLIKNEVLLLTEMGHSIFIPKIPQIKVGAAVTYAYDDALRIEKEDLEILNQCDFYGKVCGRTVFSICNKYFDVAMIDYSRCILEGFLLFFRGIIVLRPMFCGQGNFTQRVYEDIGFWALHRIMKMKNSFFTVRLDVDQIEPTDTLCMNHLLNFPCLPIAEKKKSLGGRGILYICNGVKTYPQVHENYMLVRKAFLNIDITFMGKQMIAEESDSGIQTLDMATDFGEKIAEYDCLLYVSIAEEEMPFYLLDALHKEVPVVFLHNGILDSILGKKAAGRCRTIREALKLCCRLRKNRGYRKRIASEQSCAYEKFLRRQEGLCREISLQFQKWEIEGKEIKNVKNSYKLGVVMPNAYTGGVLDYTERLIYALKEGSKASNRRLEIVFGYVGHPVYEKMDYFHKLREMDVAVREFSWEKLSAKRVRTSYLYQGYDLCVEDTEYVALNDGMSYFEDCDVLLFTADRVGGSFYSNIPYGVILHDYIQRYVPEILENHYEGQLSFMRCARSALSCFTTTQDILQEAVFYAGIDRSRVHLIQLFFGEVANMQHRKNNRDEQYFLWSTNTARHKNHKFALEALLRYYEEGGSLKCVITGANTDKFNIKQKLRINDEYIEEIRDIFQSNPVLQENISIKGNLPKQTYFQLLSDAKFFFNTSCNDNGNGTAFDAAILGVRTLSCDYAAMRNMDRVTSMHMSFYENNNVTDAVRALKEMEKRNDVTMMPSREQLQKHVVTHNKNLCLNIYKAICEFLPC